MSLRELLLVLLVVVGLVLFLAGANYFNGVIGWIGVAMVVIGVIGYLGIRAYEYMEEKS